MRRILKTLTLLAVLVSISYCSDPLPPPGATEDPGTAPTTATVTRAEFDSLAAKVNKQEAEIKALRKAFTESRDGGFFGGGFILLLLAGMGYLIYGNWGRLKKELGQPRNDANADGNTDNSKTDSRPLEENGNLREQGTPTRPKPVTTFNQDRQVASAGAAGTSDSTPQVTPNPQQPPAQHSPVPDYHPRPQQPSGRPPTDAPGAPQPPVSEERLYAEQPANGLFLTNRIAEVPDNFSAYSLTPEPGGQRGTFDVMDDPEVQQQILNSKASYGQAIEFRGDGNYIVDTTPGSLTKEDGGWRIVTRIVVHLG